MAAIMVALSALALPHRHAAGHTILLSRGGCIVHADRVAVELDIGGEDFLHLYRIRATADGYYASDVRDAAARHQHRVLDHFVIRDEAGERLSGRVAGMTFAAPVAERIDILELKRLTARYTLVFATSRPPRFLTFQQRIEDEAAVGPSQLVLSVRTPGQPNELLVLLTSRGNAETLEFDASRLAATPTGPTSSQRPHAPVAGAPAPAHAAASNPLMGADRFKAIFAIVRPDAEGVRVDVSIPAPVLETFLPLPRRDGDFLGPDEAAAAVERLRAFLPSRLTLYAEGRPVTGKVEGLAFLAPAEGFGAAALPSTRGPAAGNDVAGVAHDRRLGYWSARLAWSMRYPFASLPADVQLDWDLFSPQVLSATVWLAEGDRPPVEHILMPGSARLNWRRLPATASPRGGE